jgi:hypothetical protein
MATITGFTAERMLVIENETVVDGEVQGDNLFLTRRDGIQIDTGNVRGPKGDKGDTGTPGVVTSVNDVTAPNIYSPRIFPNKAAIDGWSTAQVGSLALAADTAVTWEKDAVGWFIVNSPRIFNDPVERDSRWINPPDGSLCQAPIGVDFRRVNGSWLPRDGLAVHFNCVQSPGQSIPARVWTNITAMSVRENLGGGSFANGIYTFPAEGRYLVTAMLLWGNPAGAYSYQAQLGFGGSPSPGAGPNGQTWAQPNAAGNSGSPVNVAVRHCFAGSTVVLQGYNGAGAAVSTFAGYGWLSVDRIE